MLAKAFLHVRFELLGMQTSTNFFDPLCLPMLAVVRTAIIRWHELGAEQRQLSHRL